MKRRFAFSFFFILFFTLLFCGIFFFHVPKKLSAQKDFTNYLDQLFTDWVSSDSVTLHYHLAHPEKYGIKEISPSLCNSYFSNAQDYQKELHKLHTFSPKALNKTQKKTYHILEDYLSRQKKTAQFSLYERTFSPTTGLQAQLPVTFCEYPLRTQEDILTYFSLLKETPDYFAQLFKIEKAKAEKGLFLSDPILDQVISQMRAFLKEKSDNPMITTFTERIRHLPLSKKQKKYYAAQNKAIILYTFLPAYKTLMEHLLSLKGHSVNDLGLCYYKDGREYYRALVSSLTGSDKSIEEMIRMTDENISNCYDELEEILYLHPDAYEDFLDSDLKKCVPSSEIKTLHWLKEKLPASFPNSSLTEIRLKKVPACLEDHVSPAFFMIPAIDDHKTNTIYLNHKALSALSSPYSTLAHEGYPGHLYQTTYFYEHLDHPILSLCDYNGYVEGWAVYAENLSYSFLDYGKNSSLIAKLYQLNHTLNLAIPSRIDLGIHYEGWNKKNVTNFLSTLGLEKEEVSFDIFDSILAEPANYLSYYIGFLEILALEQDYDNITKETRKNTSFYYHFLSNGPCDFSYLRRSFTTTKEKLPTYLTLLSKYSIILE